MKSVLAILMLVASTSAVKVTWGVKDLPEGDDGQESIFKMFDATKDEEVDNTMDSLKEAEAAMNKHIDTPDRGFFQELNEENKKTW
mgnify:CR=1 FL=1